MKDTQSLILTVKLPSYAAEKTYKTIRLDQESHPLIRVPCVSRHWNGQGVIPSQAQVFSTT